MTETPGSDDQPETTPGDQSPPPPPPYGYPPQGGYPPPYGHQPPPGYGQPPAAPWGFTGDASAPFGRDPVSGLPFSDKSKTVAGLLQLLLPCVGVCGVGRLVTGHLAIGLIQLIGFWVGFFLLFVIVGIFIVPAIWIWSVVDGILILSGSVKDSRGLPLRP